MTQAPPEAPQAPQPQPPMGPVDNPGKGLSIAGMVLGIVCLAIMCIPYLNFVSIPCAIVGLILSIMGKKKSKAAGAPTGMATAGIVLSIIALALAVIIVVIVGLIFGVLLAAGNQMQMQLQQGANSPANGAINLLKMFF